MRLHRFIFDTDLSADQLSISDRETTNQIRNVLRLDVGGRFVVCDGKGKEATVQIVSADSIVIVDVLDRHTVGTESAIDVTLYCAVLKREHFELVVEKTTECGITRIVPILTTRTVKLGLRRERLQKIAREAAEQSGRGVVAEIAEPISLKEAIAHSQTNTTNIIFAPGAPTFHFSVSHVQVPTLGLFVGPEGGWTDEEVELLRSHGMIAAGLGPRILRAETAAIVAVFLSTSAG